MARLTVLKLKSMKDISRIPKYKQIVDSIIDDVAKGKLIEVGQKIPSINELSEAGRI